MENKQCCSHHNHDRAHHGHNHDHGHTHHVTKESFSLMTYAPLFITLALVAGLAAYTTYFRTAFGNFETFMMDFMGFFFVIFAFFKLLDIKGFAENFAQYDLLAARSRAYALAYPFIELGLGIAYLMAFQMTYTLIATIIIMTFGTIGVVQATKKRKGIKCACLGAVINLPLSTVTIIENVGMAVMAIIMLLV